jgi:hypothetical protein
LLLLAERLAPTERDVFEILGYEPNCVVREDARERGVWPLPDPCGQCPQELFHSATEFDVFYGGAAGGGKTKALLLEGIKKADKHAGLRVGAFRRTYDELAESFFKELIGINYAEDIGCRWNGTDRELRFPNSSVIRFRYLESVQDATRRQGGEYQLVLIDERTMILPAAVSIVIDERVRSGSNVPVIGIRSASNPGSIGHASVKERYVDATDGGLKTYLDDSGRTVRFIPAKVDDNPHVDAGYKSRLQSIPDPHRRKAMLEGDWDTFAGQFFSEWNRERHVVRPFEIPKQWRRIAGIDWGFAAPWAVEWAAIDGDRRVWLYRELYDTEVGEHDQAKRILTAEGALTTDGKVARLPGERVDVRVADPSMWGRRGDATPIAQVYAGEGCHLLPADNDRVNGWQRVHSYLAEGPACRLHRALGWETCPWLHVFETCVNVIRTLPALPHDDKKPEDVDTDAEDHAPDALRYLLMRLSVPQAAKERKPEPETIQERIDTHLAERIRNKRRRSGAVIGS